MSLVSLQYLPDQITQLRQAVRDRMLHESPYVRQPNFIKLSHADLLLLFRLYDQLFFQGKLNDLVIEKTGSSLTLSVSGAMTSAGGKTSRYRYRLPNGSIQTCYRIAVAGRLLFNSFASDGRPIHVAGQECSDRLDAMMRIMEHELIHLLEMLTFGNSSCSQTRFMTLAQRLFGHSHPRHGLVTTRELAATRHQLKAGDWVEFTHEGQTLKGFINHIAVRATVLVPDPRGQCYSDGKHYLKFYVPLSRLTRLEGAA